MGMETMGDGRWVTVTEIGRYLRSWCVYMLWVVYHRYHFVFCTNFVLSCGDVIACLSVLSVFLLRDSHGWPAGFSWSLVLWCGRSWSLWSGLAGWMDGGLFLTHMGAVDCVLARNTYVHTSIPYHTILHTYPIHIPSHPDYRTDPSIHPVPCHATFPHLPTHAHFTSYVACTCTCTCTRRGGQSKSKQVMMAGCRHEVGSRG